MPESSETSPYDAVTYPSKPYAFTQPDWLAPIGVIYGMNPARPDKCRMLEIGCAGGGNIIPLAERYPGAEFVGIDLSARQIAAGQAMIQRLGLSNIRLEQRNILDIGAELGTFDYIVAHGFYSWVPPAVADKLLEVSRALLRPQGLAMISYNAYPGYHFRRVIRDLLLYRCRHLTEPSDKAREARAALEFFANFVPAGSNGYRDWFRAENERLRATESSFFLHDEMEVDNHPCYFHEFVEHSGRHGLKYVADAETITSQLETLPREIAEPLRAMATDAIDYEQYADFLNLACFRQSILCHSSVKLESAPSPARGLDLYMNCPAKPKEPPDLASMTPAKFVAKKGEITTANPMLKAILLILAEIWPRSLPVRDLIAQARVRIRGASAGGAGPAPDDGRVMQLLVPAFCSRNVEFQTLAPAFTTVISARPVVSPYARLQAQTESVVTNRRHHTVKIDELIRQAAQRLDGTRDREALRNELSEAIAGGSINIPELFPTPVDREQIRQRLVQPLESVLKSLAYHALLIA
jgi:methyltransferase-like protein/2-polyprenyl-3-methyl-5-hydroxy-6-metoxy-1,4-benzoquinol methylase